MKNLFFLFSIFMLTLTPLTAQLEYGVKAGLNLANVYSSKLNTGEGFNERLKAEIVLKPQLGVWINILVSDQFSVQPELLFTQKGWKPEQDGAEAPTTLHFNYISLPLLVNYHHHNWRFEAGPEVSFLINQYYSESVGIFGDKNPFIEEQKLELALNTGVRYQFNRWQLGIRYNIDVTPFVSFEFTDVNGEPIEGDPLNYYHQGLQLALGYRL